LSIGSGVAWENRGAFQLVLLRRAGLLPHHQFLDYGCGPARGGVHLVKYLDPGHYTGIDINPDYVRAARTIVENQGLAYRRPTFVVMSDYYDVQRFDFCLLFSVLNHCTPSEIAAFFRFIKPRLSPTGAVFITHTAKLALAHQDQGFERARAFTSADFDITEFGWTSAANVFPVIELRPTESPME
jgi:SAM-dependent methyltransferase